MAMTCCEITWLLTLLTDLGFTRDQLLPIDLHCDNQAALYIVQNPVFHERTKHIEVDCHYIRDKLKIGEIKSVHISTWNQVADIFTKAIPMDQFHQLLSKLRVINPFALST